MTAGELFNHLRERGVSFLAYGGASSQMSFVLFPGTPAGAMEIVHHAVELETHRELLFLLTLGQGHRN